MYNIQSIVMEYKWIALVMAPKHESENSGTCTASPPRGKSEPFPACPDAFRKEKKL